MIYSAVGSNVCPLDQGAEHYKPCERPQKNILSTLSTFINIFLALAATMQLNEPPLPPVRLSVCHTFSQCCRHRIIITYPGVINIDKSVVHGEGQGQKTKVKVTEFKTNFAPI